MHHITTLISGLLFGLGLALSGMLNPQKIQGFLDITGQWDPSLAFVMGGGVLVNFIGYHALSKNRAPLFVKQNHLPTKHTIDRALILGSIIFGIGWAITGLCPGPIIANLAINPTNILGVLACLMLGLYAGKIARIKLVDPVKN